jgi:hypothetical protein
MFKILKFHGKILRFHGPENNVITYGRQILLPGAHKYTEGDDQLWNKLVFFNVLLKLMVAMVNVGLLVIYLYNFFFLAAAAYRRQRNEWQVFFLPGPSFLGSQQQAKI